MLTAQQVGRFEIRDFLGRGAIGDVYLAWDPHGAGEVALKVVRIHQRRPRDAGGGEERRRAPGSSSPRVAPQVAAVYEWGEDGGFFWVAMEYVAGTDLSQSLARGPLPEDTGGVASPASSAPCSRSATSSRPRSAGGRIYGIVHGDIKPENIRLQEDDRVRVLDFGIAKHLSQTRQVHRQPVRQPPLHAARAARPRRRRPPLGPLGGRGRALHDGRRLLAVRRRRPRGGRGEDPPRRAAGAAAGHVPPALSRIIDRSLAFQVARR